MDVNYTTLTKANVYLRNNLAGYLEKLGPQKYVFEYSSEYIKSKGISIGLSLDISKAKFETEKLHPFFDNLIPEGWLLRHAEKAHKIDKDNRFAILLATGREPVGAVRVIPVNEHGREIEADVEHDEDENEEVYELSPPKISEYCTYCLKQLGSAIDKQHGFHQKCAKSMWGTTRKLKIGLNKTDPLDSFRKTIYGASISGAQRKGLFDLTSGVLRPSTNKAHFILKPPGDYDQLAENEHVTMVIAREIGFKVPDIGIFESKVGRIFAIKRFDLIDGEQARLEDIAQILQIPSEDKYESSNEKVAYIINQYSDIPKIDLIDFWNRLLFCYLTANADMHLKNWSLLEIKTLKGFFSLSPCYDLLNTRLPIPKEKIDIGLTINGKSSNLQWSYFRNFAKNELGLDDKIITSQRDKLQDWFQTIQQKVSICCLDDSKKEQYIKISKSRLDILLA